METWRDTRWEPYRITHLHISHTMLRAAQQSTSRVFARSVASPALRTNQAVASQRRAFGGSSYNEPSGYLFGERPLKAGEKRPKEGWENLWYYGFFGSMAIAAVFYAYKPDRSITTWARGEALKNLEASGKPWKYEPSPYSGHPNGC